MITVSNRQPVSLDGFRGQLNVITLADPFVGTGTEALITFNGAIVNQTGAPVDISLVEMTLVLAGQVIRNAQIIPSQPIPTGTHAFTLSVPVFDTDRPLGDFQVAMSAYDANNNLVRQRISAVLGTIS